MPKNSLFSARETRHREKPLERVRRGLLEQVSGDVIELGAGDGKSLPFYPYGSMNSLTLVDMRFSKLTKSHDFGHLPVTIISQRPDVLPFERHSFDHACLFLALSSMPEPYRALAELRRTLRPGGSVLFIEYLRPRGAAGLLFDSASLVRSVTTRGGVSLSRNVISMLEVAGFRICGLSRCGNLYVYGHAERI